MKKQLLIASAAILTAAGLLIAQAPGGPGAAKGKGKGPGAFKGKGKGGYQPPEGPAPMMPWGVPDLSGVWARPYTPNMEAQAGGPLPYTEWGKQMWESYNPREDGDYTGACLPFGHMRSMNSPDPIQIMQTKDHLAFLYEQNTWFKVLPIDGRARKPKVPTWFGDSIGHWDNGTLVIETVNFNGLTRLDTQGHPHSDQMSLLETFQRTDLGHIAYEVTVTDPKTFTQPWKNTRTFTLRTDWEIQEYSCEENNKGVVEGRIKVPDFSNLK